MLVDQPRLNPAGADNTLDLVGGGRNNRRECCGGGDQDGEC